MSDEAGKHPSSRLARVGDIVNIEFPLFLGFFVHLCWLFFMSSDFMPWLMEPDSDLSSVYLGFSIAFACSFVIASFSLGMLRDRITFRMRHKGSHISVAILGVVGCLLYTGIATAPIPLLFSIPSALLCGLSYALITVLWGEASRRRSFARLTFVTCLTLIAASVTGPAIDHYVSKEFLYIVICIAPLISIVFLYKAQHDNESYFKPQEFVVLPDGTRRAKEGQLWEETYHDLKISKWRFAVKLGRSSLFFGLTFGILVFESYSFLRGWDSLVASAWSVVFSLAAVFAFFLLFKSFNPIEQANPSKRLFSFFIVFMLFSSSGPMLSGSYTAGPEALGLVVMFATMLWIYPAELTHRYRISALLTFGFFVSFLAFGATVSIACCLMGLTEAVPWPALVALTVAFIAVGFVLLINDRQMKSIAIITEPRSASGAEAPLHGHGAFTQRCQKAADIFLLSGREEEILFLLAKGRNASYIQKELVISEGTARTHMRNIYRKMNVHNQQELMDLVESLEV